MKVLFATNNPAKIHYYAEALEEKGIEVITLKDIDTQVEIEENGKTAVENAKIKAEGYYKLVHIPTVAIDDNLFLEGIPEENQPGTHVRRVNGKRLNDDEMIQYYTTMVHQYGGQVEAKWVKGIAVYDGKEMKTFCKSRDSFYFLDHASLVRHEGYPLDSIAYVPEFKKYLSELTPEEEKVYRRFQNANGEMIEFIWKSLEEMGEKNG